MAITWTIKITDVNVASKRATVQATRTDSLKPDSPSVYTFMHTPVGTAADRLLLLNTIKAKVVADASLVTSVQNVVTTLEQDGKAALESWERGR